MGSPRRRIFNFVATNTIEGTSSSCLLDKLQEMRDPLDDDAVLPAAYVERVLRDYYAGRLGGEDLEERLLRDVDERRFRNICQNALEGLASKKLNPEMLVERRARARARRVMNPATSPYSLRGRLQQHGAPVGAGVRLIEPGEQWLVEQVREQDSL